MVAEADLLITSCHVLLRDPNTRGYWFGLRKSGVAARKRVPPGGHVCSEDLSLADAATRNLRAQWNLDPDWLRRFHPGMLRLLAAVVYQHSDQPKLSRNVFYFVVDYVGLPPTTVDPSPTVASGPQISDPRLYLPDHLTNHSLWPADRLWLPVVLYLQPMTSAYCARYSYIDDDVFEIEHLREPPMTRQPLFHVTAR